MSTTKKSFLKYGLKVAALAWTSIACLWSGGCSTGLQSELRGRNARIPTAAIALGAFDLHLTGVTSWQHYDRQRDILRVLEHSPFDAIAPSEFRSVFRPTKPDQWLKHTSLPPRVREMGLAIEEVVILEITIESTYSEQHVDLTARKVLENSTQANTSQGRLQAYVVLHHPSSNRTLMRYSRVQSENRFTEIDETDARPEMTRFLNQVLKELLSLISEQRILAVVPPRRTKPPPRVRENPMAVLDHGYDSKTLRTYLKNMDTTLADAMLYGRVRAHDKTLSTDRFSSDRNAPLGVEALENTGSVTKGDRIVCVDGKPIIGTWQWRRAFRRGPFRQVTRARGDRAEAVSPHVSAPAGPPPEACLRLVR